MLEAVQEEIEAKRNALQRHSTEISGLKEDIINNFDNIVVCMEDARFEQIIQKYSSCVDDIQRQFDDLKLAYYSTYEEIVEQPKKMERINKALQDCLSHIYKLFDNRATPASVSTSLYSSHVDGNPLTADEMKKINECFYSNASRNYSLANLRSNKSFESLGIHSSKKIQVKESPDRGKDNNTRPVSTLTSNRESVTSKEKLLSARVGITEPAFNISLPIARKQASEKRLNVDIPPILVGSDTQEVPVRIGPQGSEGFVSDDSDLNSPGQGGHIRISLSPKPVEKLKSKEKLASIVAKNTESRKN